MLHLDNRRANKIDSIFVIALFTVFAITSFLLIFIGAKQYQHTANTMDSNYESRTISSYLTEKIRQHDCEGAIYLCDLEGTNALALETTENEITYVTYIYYHDGAIREIIVTNSSVFSLSSGQEIVATNGFHAEQKQPDLFKITITTTNGNTEHIYLSLHSNARKEQT